MRIWGMPDRLARWIVNLLFRRRDPEFKELARKMVHFTFVNVLVLLFALYTVYRLVLSERDHVVPDLTEMPLVDALHDLKGIPLRVEVEPRYFDYVPQGLITEQTPAPGSRVREGRVVRLTVSRGPILSEVPNFLGKTKFFVETFLRNKGASRTKRIAVEAEEEYSDEFPRGTVIDQDPPPGESMKGVETISLVISAGRNIDEIEIENYVGQDWKYAAEEMEQFGVVPRWVDKPTKKKGEDGVILDQTPKAGKRISSGDTVTFVRGTYAPGRDDSKRLRRVYARYVLPKGGFARQVRMVLVDRSRTKTVFAGMVEPGQEILKPVECYPGAKLKIYVNGELQSTKVY